MYDLFSDYQRRFEFGGFVFVALIVLDVGRYFRIGVIQVRMTIVLLLNCSSYV